MIHYRLRSARTNTFVRYVVIGGLAFSIDLAITLVLAMRWHYLIASTIGFVIANLVQFILVHRWVFRRSFKRRTLVRNYAATLSISLFGLVCTSILVFVGVDILSMSLTATKAATAVIVLFINYSLRVAVLYGHGRPEL
jgi:putative flippase GtrA